MAFSLFGNSKPKPAGEYVIGVSSGMFSMAKPEEKISLIDISQKGFYSALKGVNFTQVDIERSTEFISPDLENKMAKLRKDLNIEIGFHGLCGAMGSKGIFLDSAIEDDYRRTHDSLVKDLERSGKLNAKYYLQHASETTPYGWLGKDFQPSSIVDIWGRRFHDFLNENPSLIDWAIKEDTVFEIVGGTREGRYDEVLENTRKSIEDKIRYEDRRFDKLSEEQKSEAINMQIADVKRELRSRLLSFSSSSNLTYGPERVAYYITAKWMSDKRDPLWCGVVGDKTFEEVKGDTKIWVPAVSLKYIWGHLNPKTLKDPKPILEKYNIDFVIETAMVGAGMEEEYRLTNPKHFVVLCKHAGTKHCRAAIDFEHILGAGIDPLKNCIDEMESDGGKYVGVLHVGWPTPVEPAHVPIPLGSEQQEWLYTWMLALRKKGFDERENKYIIFERGGGVGGDPVDQSTLALRKIIEYLKMDVSVADLPPEFYGIEEKDLRMQDAEIMEHAFDPIKGLITTPEGKHGFLSKAALEKGKSKEWETEKYR